MEITFPEDGRVLWQDERMVLSWHAGSSPRAADIAFASIAYEAPLRPTPGQLHQYVLHALGAVYSDLPTPAMLSSGFHVRQTPSGARAVFVVTIQGLADAATLLRTNLRHALNSFGSELSGKTIWLPLMGTGGAGLSMETSLEITLEVLLETKLAVPGHPARVQIDVPLDLPRRSRKKLYRNALALLMNEPPARAGYWQRAVPSPPERWTNSGAALGVDAAGERALLALLSELFDNDADGLRQWVRLALGREVHQSLPGGPVTFDSLCFQLVLRVQERGLVTESFFTNLSDARPAQSARIRAVAALWHGRPQTQPDYPDDRTRLLSERLADAYVRKRALNAAGADTSVVVQEILRLKRSIRSGGQLRPGDRLGENRYLLLERIGRGGFANVWKALDQVSGEHVAIKVLHGELAGDVIRRGRFFRGARIMAELDHPAVVRILEPHGEDDGYHYFVMELITGGDLRQAVLQGRVEVAMVVPLLLDLGDALAVAHAHGFIHRDIKPANVLLNEIGEPRLADFDLVAAGDTTGGTQTGALGTFVYAAPEMLEHPQDADARADVYGLGMTAAFMLHGADLPRSVLRDAAGFIAKLSCDEPLKQILQQAVSWEPEDRFADAAVLCQALRDYAQPAPRVESSREAHESAHTSSGEAMAESFVEPFSGIRFLLVPGGRFTMGARHLHPDCEPPHLVAISAFWLADTPVTRHQYEQFLTATSYPEPKLWRSHRFAHPNQPVVSVSWTDAQNYCRWLSTMSGLTVALPTEAQWEFAARGEEGYAYPWGNEAPDSVRAHFGRGLKDAPLPVGRLLSGRGPYGHLDQSGNVWEWCQDLWDASAYARRGSLTVDPIVLQTENSGRRVTRGGGFTSVATALHAAYRSPGPSSSARSIGFRVAASVSLAAQDTRR